MSTYDSNKNGGSKQPRTSKSKTRKGEGTMKKSKTTQQKSKTTQQKGKTSKKREANLKPTKGNPEKPARDVKKRGSTGEDRLLNTPREYEARAAQKLRDGDNEGAVGDMASAVRMNPNDIELLCKLGVVFHKTCRYGEAIRAYNDALYWTQDHSPLQPNRRYGWKVKLLYRRADALYEKGEHQRSLEGCNRVIDLINGWDSHPDGNVFYQRALLARGKIFIKLNDHSNSLKDLRNLKEIVPDYHEAFFMLAVAIDLKNKRESIIDNYDNREAIENYDKAIELYPNYGNALFHRGNALFREKKLKLARMDYEAVLHLDPNHADALTALAKVCLEMGERERALELNPDGRRGRDIVYVYGFIDARDVLKAARNLNNDAQDQGGRGGQCGQGNNSIDDELSEDDILCE